MSNPVKNLDLTVTLPRHEEIYVKLTEYEQILKDIPFLFIKNIFIRQVKKNKTKVSLKRAALSSPF